jgi:hypothetical protein
MIRELLEKWLDVDKISSEAYDRGFKSGIDVTVEQYEDRMERRAINMFSEAGYPNPLHVFDISQGGIPYLNLEPITKPKALQLSQEAGLLKSMLLYDVIQESIKQEAMNKAVTCSKNWEEVLAGKMMLRNLGVIKKIIDTIQAINVDKLPEGIGSPSQKVL